MIRLLIRAINDLKLRTKLVLSFLVVVFIPLMIVGGFLTSQLRQMALDNALEQTAANVDRVKKRTAEVINVSNDISYRLANDSRLENVTNRQYESVYDVVKAYKDYPDIKDYIRLYKEISGIRLYINNKTLLNNWEFIQPSAAVLESDWYKQAERSNGLIGWNYIEDERDHHKYLSLIRKIDFVNHHNKGILVINVNSRLLNSILNQETFETMIVDANNHIISANRPDRIGKTLAEINFDPVLLNSKAEASKRLLTGNHHKFKLKRFYRIQV